MKTLAAIVILMISVTNVSSIFFEVCKGVADIVVAIPGSDIVTTAQLKIFEEFFTNFVEYFPLNINDGSRIGFVQYGRNATVTSSLEPFKTQIELSTRISLMARREISPSAYMGGYNPAEGIDATRQELAKSARSGAKAIGLLVTVGPTPDRYINDVIESSRAALAGNITMFAISMLSAGPEFAEMTDESCKRFHITDYGGMLITLPFVATQICNYVHNIPAFPVLCLLPGKPLLKPPAQPPFNCPSPNGDFADQTNCAYYYNCTNGEPERTMCKIGLIFDPQTKNCDLKEKSSCYADYSCPVGFKGLLPYVGDCTKYVNCWDGSPHVQKCVEGLYFDETLQTCDYAVNVLCQNDNMKDIPLY